MQARSITLGVTGATAVAPGANALVGAANLLNPYINGYIRKMKLSVLVTGVGVANSTTIFGIGSAAAAIQWELLRGMSFAPALQAGNGPYFDWTQQAYDGFGSYGIRIETGNTSLIGSNSLINGLTWHVELVISPP